MTQEQTQTLTPIEQEAPRFLTLKVTDHNTLQEASTYLVSAKKEYKAIKADMDTLLDPIKESIDLIKEKYDPRLKALKCVIEALTTETTQYQTKLINDQQKAQQSITAKVESGYIKPETAIDKLSNLPTIEKKIETEAGGMSFVPYPMCEVEDITKVPMQFHTVDMVAIRAEMKAGNKHDGIRYWVEQRPKNNR